MRTPTTERFWPKVQKTATCWYWVAHRAPNGYGRILHDDKVQDAHRVAYQLLVGPIPEGMWVLHKCDVKPCVNPDHLYLGTVVENTRDAVERGRVPRNTLRLEPERASHGTSHYRAKVTDQDVRTIRFLASSGIPQRAIGRKFDIDQSTVSSIVTRKGWKHV